MMESASASEESVQATLAQQGAMLDQHSSLLTSASHDFQVLSNQLSEVRNRLDQVTQAFGERGRPVSVADVSNSNERETHAVNPPSYDGDTSTCRAFLGQCSLVFALQPRRFATEMSKIAFVLTLLTGRARDWGMAVWEAKMPCCNDFETFKGEMCKLFDRTLRGDLAAAELNRFVQGTQSVTDYAIHFKTLAVTSGWNDSALRAQFLSGLKDNIQDEIASHDFPVSLEGMIDLALRVEARHRQRRIRRTATQHLLDPSLHVTETTSAPLSSSVEPMQLGRLRLTTEERQHRLVNGLCLYCGKPGHRALNCPVKGAARR